MKLTLLPMAAALVFSATAHADDTYVQVHLGAFVQTDDGVDINERGTGGLALDVDASTDTTFAVGGLIGHHILPAIALEAEVTHRRSQADHYPENVVLAGLDNDYDTVALMANGVFRPTVPLLPQPYLGFGVGYLTNSLDDVDGAFAYQVKAGATVDVLPTPGRVGVELNYLFTDGFDRTFSGTVCPPDVLCASVLTDYDVTYNFGGLSMVLIYQIGF
ncbi:MAG: outer membrane beta-barrel protein [Pseudomonadota bacterium]